MRFPLDNWLSLKFGYRFGQKTTYNNFHLGLDVIVPVGTALYAPEDGKITSSVYGTRLGNTVLFKGKSGVLWRFGHLRVKNNVGDYLQGAVIGSTGFTGSLKGDTPHLHFDISKNGTLELKNLSNFIDPESYLNEGVLNKRLMTREEIITLWRLAFHADPQEAEITKYSSKPIIDVLHAVGDYGSWKEQNFLIHYLRDKLGTKF